MPRTLLLADDSITIQKVVSITFAAEDFTVVTVDNGEDAFARARELRPAIVIADVAMPRRNGYELSQALKSDPELQGIPVLLLAGTFEPLDPAKAAASQANGHLVKPFDTQALIDKVTELLGGSAAVAAPAASPSGMAQAAAPRAATPAWQQGVPARPQPMSFPLAPPPAQPTAQPTGGPPQRPVPLTAPQARPSTSPFGIPAAATASVPAAAAARPAVPIPLTPAAAAPRAPLPLTSAVAPQATSPLPAAPSAIPVRPAGVAGPAAFAAPVPQRVSPFAPPQATPSSGAPANPGANPAAAAPSPFGRPAAPSPAPGPAVPQRVPVAPTPARVPMPFPAASPAPAPSAWGEALGSQPAPGAFAPPAPSPSPAFSPSLPAPRVPAPAPAAAAPAPAPTPMLADPFGDIPGFDSPGPLEISGMAEAAAAASVHSSPNDLSLDVPMDEDPPELLPEIDGFELGSSQDLDVSMTGGSASDFISGELSDFSQQGGAAPVDGLEFDSTSEHEQPLELASPHEFMDLMATQPIKPPAPAPVPPPPNPAARIAIPLSIPAVPAIPAKAPIQLTPAATASASPTDGEAALRQALSQASREVIERVVWEVVPQLAEVILREHVERMARERQ